MPQNQRSDPLNDTRFLLDRRLCELEGCVMAERAKPRPSEYLIEEWKAIIDELQAERHALCERCANLHQSVVTKHAAAVRGVRLQAREGLHG